MRTICSMIVFAMEHPNALNSMPSTGAPRPARHVSRVQRWFHNTLAGALMTATAAFAARNNNGARAQELVASAKPDRPAAQAQDTIPQWTPLKGVEEAKQNAAGLAEAQEQINPIVHAREALEKAGMFTLDYDQFLEGKGVHSPSAIPQVQHGLGPVILQKSVFFDSGGKPSSVRTNIPLPGDIGDYGNMGFKPVVLDESGNQVEHESEVNYTEPVTGEGHRNAFLQTTVRYPKAPYTVYALIWLMTPHSRLPWALQQQALVGACGPAAPNVDAAIRAACEVTYDPSISIADADIRFGANAGDCIVKAAVGADPRLSGGFTQYVEGYCTDSILKRSNGGHAVNMVVVPGGYAFFDARSLNNCRVGILDNYIPCTVSSDRYSIDGFSPREGVNDGFFRGGRGREVNASDVFLSAPGKGPSAGFLAGRQPPPEVQRYFELRSGIRRAVNADRAPRFAQLPTLPQVQQQREKVDVTGHPSPRAKEQEKTNTGHRQILPLENLMEDRRRPSKHVFSEVPRN